MKAPIFMAALGGALLAGCGSISGLDAKTQFSCKAPDGILCESMSGIYANAVANNLPGQRVTRGTPPARPIDRNTGSGTLTPPITSGTPIRTAPLVFRVWFAPWEDSDGDLHDQSYLYLLVDNGKWLIEHNRRRIADAFRPVHAPIQAPASAAAAAAAGITVAPPSSPSDDEPALPRLPSFPAEPETTH